MRLETIKIKGFKSFADTTTIKVEEGITAVVGPNGSGKSNISDSIRWVLGEQSLKNLRGSSSTDVIFAGTQSRKALGYAEVGLVFNNESGKLPIDYNQVKISRRLFKSGESEYFINNNQVRLKDVRELFMDTGIGKEGYSIIGQGRIDEILSNRSQDRRSIFEEAAGIIKYRTRKEESERKLKRSNENLKRIRDILYELEKQNNNLEKQANKAIVYKEKSEKLKNMEVRMFSTKLEELEKDISYKQEMENNINIELENKTNQEEKLEKELSDIDKGLEDLRKKIEENEELNNNIKEEISDYNYKLDLYFERKKYDDEKIERFKNDLDSAIKNEEDFKLELFEVEKKIQFNKKELHKTQSELEAFKKKSSKELSDFLGLESEQDEKQKILLNMYDSRSKLNTELIGLNNIEKGLIESLNNFQERNLEIKIDLNKLKEEEIKIIKEVEEKENIKENAENNSKDKLNKIKHLNNEIIDLRKEEKEVELSLERASSKINILDNMESSLEGYYRGVKSVLRRQRDSENKLFPKLDGSVLELFNVESQYQIAIENALGGSIQNLVTENEEEGKRIIDYLRENRLGKVTILPKSVIRGRRENLNRDIFKKYNILGLAVDLIDFKKEYDDIFTYLLGRTIIVKDLEDGIRLNQDHRHRYKIVTLKGDILFPGGSMSGGSNKNENLGLVGRKTEIRDLNKKIKELKSKILLVRDKIQNLEEKISLEEEAYQKEIDTIQDVSYVIEVLKRDRYLKLQKEENLKIESKKINEKTTSYERENKQIKDEITIKELELRKFEKKIEEYQKDMELQAENIKSTREQREELLGEINSYNIIIEKVSAEIRNLEGKKIDLLSDLNNNKILRSKILDEKEITKKSLAVIEKDQENIKEQIENKIKEKLNYENLIKKYKQEYDSIYEENKLFLNEREKINKEIMELKEELLKTSLSIDKFKFEKDRYIKDLFEKYDLVPDNLKAEISKFDSFEFTKEDISKLKKDIRSLGDVNLNSIEEFKEVNERYEFYLTQKKDLDNGINDLNHIISDMENKMEKDFKSVFMEINNNFKEIFKILFSGGNAELKIEDENDILNSGIEIVAEPPGKKLQNISLLSGGEKSLTAVAILFSILAIKPAPFCILDEIDAALDESNIGRYTEYLETLKSKTQFLIITHRKKTMEIADTIYGVTMEEQGVSKILSIKLEDR